MKTVKFRQSNMYCNACFINAVNALTGIRGVCALDIDMKNKTICLQMEDDAMGRKKIQALIGTALRTGISPAFTYQIRGDCYGSKNPCKKYGLQ